MAKKAHVSKDEVEGEVSAAPVKAQSKPRKEGDDSDEVIVNLPVTLKIKRVVYQPGEHRVPRHVAETMKEMVDKKMKADLSIFIGKNYQFQYLVGGGKIAREVGDKN